MLPGGLAVVGDPAVYVTAGDRRLADVAPDGEMVVTGAPGEEVEVVGWDVEVGEPLARTVTLSDRGWSTVRLR